MSREYCPEDSAAQRAIAGARLAAMSVAAGALATIASLIGVAYVATVGSLSPRPRRTPTSSLHSAAARSAALNLRVDGAPEGSGRPVREQRIGGLVLVDIGAQIASLDEELDHQRKLAFRNREQLVLWLVVEDCKPCNAIEAALPNGAMQRAFGHTRLVRLDGMEFLSELSRLGVPVDAFPAFVLLGKDGHATDYVHGGEWDNDKPETIAPVLKSFLDGTYVKRRAPWHGGPHDDQTSI